VKSFDDVSALANHIGCDASALEHTLQSVKAGVCAQTGRLFQRALQAPFHAVRVTGALFHTQGGLDINAQCQVLGNNDQQPLPNLLAAGGAARGVSGNAVWGYLSGNGLLSAIAGGHIAAHTVAQLIAPNLKSSHQSA
jgi:fumarate reductase flavoprotein subunit